jgi:hypothetical protein
MNVVTLGGSAAGSAAANAAKDVAKIAKLKDQFTKLKAAFTQSANMKKLVEKAKTIKTTADAVK